MIPFVNNSGAREVFLEILLLKILEALELGIARKTCIYEDSRHSEL
jgi:hypothetical protein